MGQRKLFFSRTYQTLETKGKTKKKAEKLINTKLLFYFIVL